MTVLTGIWPGGEPTLGDLERAGALPKELIGHFNEIYPAGWRHLPSAQDDRLSDERIANLRAEIREGEDVIIECALRIRELEQRREELARLEQASRAQRGE